MSAIRALTVPKWGIEMQEGTITGWHKQVGETVAAGEDLIDIETDKIVNTVEAPFAGVLRRVLVGEGEVKKVGELIGVIAPPDVDDAAIDVFVANFEAADTSFEPDEDSAEKTAATATPEPGDGSGQRGEVRVSPIARRVADRLGVDLAGITGTGRHGRISKEDVEAAARAQGKLQDPAAEGAAPEERSLWEDVRLTGMQRTAARRLQEAKREIPHFYLEVDVVAARLVRVAERAGVSLNTALLKAFAIALDAVPEANVQFAGEGMRRCRRVDLGMAVATPRGLVVPVLRDVAASDLAALDRAARELAERARDRRLTADDLEGGTGTVSNLGMFGIDRFSAIVNPPQTSILAVGRAARRAVVDAEGELRAQPVVSATLSCDHRAIDGALGARVLAAFRAAVESGLERTE